ncbi:MAG TPA: twin-arginine translocase subunit TatC [Actinomycetota bacterium]|nr:twin-arginine translocase subunit TatC [Actinomycetota bacterium]
MAMDPPLGETAWARGLAGVLLRQRSLMERLGELRSRIFRALAALAACSVAAWFFYPAILHLLAQPLRSLPGAGSVIGKGTLIFTAPQEAFFVRVKVVGYAAVAAASPFILWQVWRFLTVTPGSGTGRRGATYAVILIAVSVVLFAAGTVAAFLFVSPALHIFLYLGGRHITLIPRASEYLSFLLLLVVAFGVTFEYPLFLLGLIFAGIISSGTLRRRRRLAWFLLIVVSAVVTPTVDPITPLALALPLALLYEGTIVTARLFKR